MIVFLRCFVALHAAFWLFIAAVGVWGACRDRREGYRFDPVNAWVMAGGGLMFASSLLSMGGLP